jgi:hypothetical protein
MLCEEETARHNLRKSELWAETAIAAGLTVAEHRINYGCFDVLYRLKSRIIEMNGKKYKFSRHMKVEIAFTLPNGGVGGYWIDCPVSGQFRIDCRTGDWQVGWGRPKEEDA